MSIVGDDRIFSGSEFHTVGALTEKALSPSVLNLATLCSIKWAFDDLRFLSGEYELTREDIYWGERLLRHFYTIAAKTIN